MAAGQRNATRRQVLGAVAAVPVVAASLPLGTAASPALRAGPSTAFHAVPLPSKTRGGIRWSRAVARFEAAAGRLRGVEGEMAGLAFEAAEARQGAYDACATRFYAALRRVLKAPAPDVAALGLKIRLVVDHEAATLSGGEACLAALRADAVRLCGGGDSHE